MYTPGAAILCIHVDHWELPEAEALGPSAANPTVFLWELADALRKAGGRSEIPRLEGAPTMVTFGGRHILGNPPFTMVTVELPTTDGLGWEDKLKLSEILRAVLQKHGPPDREIRVHIEPLRHRWC